ncbi:hypothetical protein [Actinoplanes couchii]|uniref:hypothetical protein n=1 Tax=Actinoplanes couchii TaxID=403638 RepID=UPI0019413EBC|nr:hypothetical protein [Actinoplanes couchii]MDR6319155.1 pimeloyl-ACP methyl ester carboxylesterase [Actinoplanes couchii]
MPERVVLLLPGAGYSPQRPLLHFAGAVFASHGWTVREIHWPMRPPQRDGQNLTDWFTRLRAFTLTYVDQLLEQETASEIALVGKSMGAFAAAAAADRSLPGVWLTPILRDTVLPADLRRCRAPFLLAGSLTDPSWDSKTAHHLGHAVYETTGADHSLEFPADPPASTRVLHELTTVMNDFVSRL